MHIVPSLGLGTQKWTANEMADSLLHGWETLQWQHDGLGESHERHLLWDWRGEERRELQGGGRETPALTKMYPKNSIYKKTYLNSKRKGKEGGRKRSSLSCLAPQMPAMARNGWDWKPEPGPPSGSPTSVAGAQGFGWTLAVFLGARTGN